MADLTNKYIYETYKSLVGIGTSGTSGLSHIPQPLTDGEGKELPIKVGENEVETIVPFLATNFYVSNNGSPVEVIDSSGFYVGPGGGGGGTGTSGTSGSSGTSGLTGSSGTSGVNGTSGTSGRNGYNGVNGSNGTSGTSGISEPGTPGTSGSSGTSGLSAVQQLTGYKAPVSLTALTNVIYDQIFIPGGSVKDATKLEITGRFFLNKNGLNAPSTSSQAVYINTTATIGGVSITAPVIAAGTSNIGGQWQRDLFVIKADGTGEGSLIFNSTSFASEAGVTNPAESATFTSGAIDWTQDQWILITVNSAITGATITSKGLSIKL